MYPSYDNKREHTHPMVVFVRSANVDEGGMFDGHGRRVVLFPDDGHPDMCNAVLDLTGDSRDYPTKILLLLLKKTRCGLHNAGPKLLALAFDIFGTEVFEVCDAERAAHRFDVKIHILTPFVVESAQQKRPDRAALGAAKTL